MDIVLYVLMYDVEGCIYDVQMWIDVECCGEEYFVVFCVVVEEVLVVKILVGVGIGDWV